MSTIIGIDLGTTHSLAAVMTDSGSQLIRNALGDVLTPSVVGFDEQGTLHIGRAAKELPGFLRIEADFERIRRMFGDERGL